MITRILRTITAFSIATAITTLSAADLGKSVSEIQDLAWKTREAAAKAGASKEASVQFEELTSLLQSKSAEFGGELMRDEQIEEFSELYKEMDPFGKENMEFVVDRLRALEFQKKQEGIESSIDLNEYFPGHGHSKPGHVYRIGEEVRREFVQSFWRDEHREEIINESKEITVDASLVAKLKIQFPELIEGLKFQVDIDGNLKWVQKVSFKKQVKVVSKTKIQWMFEKVWFKLYEAKKPKWPWGNPDYYEVGETFKHEQTPSGQQVIVDAEVKPAA